MDRQTIDAYAADSAAFAQDWHAQPPGVDLHDAIRKYFHSGPTADIGCGSGRDTAWLSANGYPCVGYDASEELLHEARRRYPDQQFVKAALPEMPGVAEKSFENVLCETVIMHLPADELVPSVRRLMALLKPHGTLYLTWRVTRGGDQRDKSGRLYAAVDTALVRQALRDGEVLLDEEVLSASSGKAIHRIVVRR
jgi:trans-aconitate methyltransferase